MARFRDARAGWTIAYPASMQRAVIDKDNGFTSARGVVIANSAKTRKAAFFRRFPPDGASFAMLHLEGPVMPDLTSPEARFPLRRSEFEREGSAPFPSPFEHSMIANGDTWVVYARFGEKASHRDQERIWRIVESLRFPPQRTGTMSGSFYVLQKASHYPVGTVVKIRDTDWPFFLVHAPGGFYAVGWDRYFEAHCLMGFDRKRHAFFCATRRGWWDRFGEPMVSPVAALVPDDVLNLGEVKVGRDGQLLCCNWGEPAKGSYERYKRRFWPEG
jgi:hypothetical protein